MPLPCFHDMEQHKINIKIAGRVYNQVVSQEDEGTIRTAADNVDSVINSFLREYKGISQLDIATIVALNAEIQCIRLKGRVEQMEQQLSELSQTLEKYVDSIE